MRKGFSIVFAVGAFFGLLALSGMSASATSFTVSPWAYACGQTVYDNPVTQQDNPGEGACKNSEPGLGNAAASYANGKLTLHKDGPQADDLASGATIGGLLHLSGASFDVTGYCGAGAPRLNIVTGDDKTHFFGCSANNTDGHVIIDLSAKGDGSGNGGVGPDDTIKSIDFVQDEVGEGNTATAVLSNLSFEGTASPTPTPSATSTATATASATPTQVPVLAKTGGGAAEAWPNPVLLLMLGVGVALIGGIELVRRIVRRQRV